MHKFLVVISCVLMGSLLAGCGKPDLVRSCEDRREPYEDAVEHGKLRVPEDLDEPDELKQLPLPEAAPAAERPADAPCLELPPGVAPSRRESDG
jgi:uncharacterized lipoprotein